MPIAEMAAKTNELFSFRGRWQAEHAIFLEMSLHEAQRPRLPGRYFDIAANVALAVKRSMLIIESL